MGFLFNIFGVSSGQAAEVDAVSKALHVTQYDSSGNELHRAHLGKYMSPVDIQPTTLTAATAYWSIWNTDLTKVIAIDEINLSLSWDGSPNANSRSTFVISRFSNASSPTGGTTLVPAKSRTSYASSIATVRNNAPAGLTMGTSVIETVPFAEWAITSQSTFQSFTDIAWGSDTDELFYLRPGEGAVIQALSAVVLGCGLIGYCSWHEYAN